MRLKAKAEVKYVRQTRENRMPSIPKNSVNRINILGSGRSPSIMKPSVVMMEDTIKMLSSFLFRRRSLIVIVQKRMSCKISIDNSPDQKKCYFISPDSLARIVVASSSCRLSRRWREWTATTGSRKISTNDRPGVED